MHKWVLILGLTLTLAGLNLYALDTAKVIRVIDGDMLKIEVKGIKEWGLIRQRVGRITRHTRTYEEQ